MDCFRSYEYDKTKPSLEQLISTCQTYNKGDSRRLDLLNQAYKYHGGLAAKIARKLSGYGIQMEYGDVYLFFWEALNYLPDAWDKGRSTVQMALASITMSLATKWANENTYRGSVRVPRQQVAKDQNGNTIKLKSGAPKRIPTQIKGVSINYDCDLESISEILKEAEDSSMLILSLAN